jgi:hypothetical protein
MRRIRSNPSKSTATSSKIKSLVGKKMKSDDKKALAELIRNRLGDT